MCVVVCKKREPVLCQTPCMVGPQKYVVLRVCGSMSCTACVGDILQGGEESWARYGMGHFPPIRPTAARLIWRK